MKYALMIVALLVCIWLMFGWTYGGDTTENAGIVIGAGGYCIGYETHGDPGIFVNVDCE